MPVRGSRRPITASLLVLLPFLLGVAGAASTVTPRFALGPTLAALAGLVVLGALGRPWLRVATSRPLSTPPGSHVPGRDSAIDLLRGLAILFVVVNHIELRSLYYLVSQERLGIITGAELFVVLSGAVLGLTFRRRGREETWRQEAGRVLRRARTLYVVAVLVTLGAYLVSQLPEVHPTAITTVTEAGTVYPTYTNTGGVLPFLTDVLLLKSGPWTFNILGLYVVLLLLSPPLLLLLLRGRVGWLLAGSWLLYLLHTLYPVKLLPAEFTTSFPPLAWQLLFVHGLAPGYHREEVRVWLHTKAGRSLVAVAALVCVGLAFSSWNNPGRFAFHLSLIPADTFSAVYADAFHRGRLGPGRLVNVAAFLVVALTLLERFWPFFARTLGWLLVPLGQATLYVYILQVGLVLLVASLSFLHGATTRLGTLTHTLLLLGLWWMVRKQVLFRWIPR